MPGPSLGKIQIALAIRLKFYGRPKEKTQPRPVYVFGYSLSKVVADNETANSPGAALEREVIVSANIGCITHLQSGTETPVRHWVEVLDAAIKQGASA